MRQGPVQLPLDGLGDALPRNSPAGFVTAFFATIMGFSLIWHIWWLAILNFVAAIIVVLIAGWSIEREREISAAEVEQMERAPA